MSYYDFDDHFWSPKQVCAQSNPVDSEYNYIGKKLINILLVIFITMGTALLMKMLIEPNNNKLNQSILKTDSFMSNCLMLKSNSVNKIGCSKLAGEKN